MTARRGADRGDADRLTRPGAVILDLDGTLVDTVSARITAWLEALGQAGFRATRHQIAPLIGIDGRRLARDVAAAAGTPIDDERAEEIDQACGIAFERRNRSPQRLPYVAELIAALQAGHIRWAIATSSRRDQVMASVAALGLTSEPTIVDGSDVRHAKPDPELLLLAARRLGVDPGDCWYVGDSTWDMAAARAAGMLAIGVTAGAAVSAAALEGAGAVTVVPTLGSLIAALAEGRPR